MPAVTNRLPAPAIDPSPIFEHFRGSLGSQLLTAAIAHFDLFGQLAQQPLSLEQLCESLNLERRPAIVLTTALCAMQLLNKDAEGRFGLTDMSRNHLVPGAPFDVSSYVGLAAGAPDVLAMVERLKTNQPAGADSDSGAAFIFRSGVKSAMEQTELARHFTLALSGRANNVAPVLADKLDLSQSKTILDIGGGTGIYSIALAKANSRLQAVVLDRPEVLKIADEFVQQHGVADQVTLTACDMFEDTYPDCDTILFSNILHDWDEPECQLLVSKAYDALPAGGQLIIHDVFLNDDLTGPLEIAHYSASLFTLTEGRAYSAAEYTHWLSSAGFATSDVVPTLIHCGYLVGQK